MLFRYFMAPRRKKTVRRRSRAISALSVLESYMYANILTQGLAGTSPIGMVTGATDLVSMETSAGVAGVANYYKTQGAEQISLGDIVQSPGLALEAFSSNFMANYQTMAVSSILTGLTFRFGKRLLRRPIGNINRNIMKPLGVGIKL